MTEESNPESTDYEQPTDDRAQCDDSVQTRCWCGAFVAHTPEGIDCSACGDEIDADLDLRPSGYEWTGGRWVQVDPDRAGDGYDIKEDPLGLTEPELMPDGGRRKTQIWGYDTHERSVLDVVDEEEWQEQLEWALSESLAYARRVADVSSTVGAAHFEFQPVIEHFEESLNDLLHRPLDICTASEKTQETEQATLVTDGCGDEWRCDGCGETYERHARAGDRCVWCVEREHVDAERADVSRQSLGVDDAADAASYRDEPPEHDPAELRTDGGTDFEVLAALERQADALEDVAEEMRYQNAVLTELAQATHKVAVAQSEIAHPEEKPEHVPSLRGLRTNIQDQAFTRGEDR